MMPKKNCRPQLFLALVLLPLYSNANDDLPLFTEEDLLIDIPQVISATHLSQRLTETPAAISIIDRRMIETSGAQNIPDLFRLVPGMNVYHVSSNKFGVSYHGVSDDFPRQMEVMINGRSVYIPLLSTVAWETMGITVDDIDHIEVVRGSNVPTHGSNAFLGAINIITRSPLQEQGTEISTTQGALSSEDYQIRHSGTAGSMQYTLSGGFSSNDGISRFNDGALTRHIHFMGSLTPSLTDTVNIELGFNNGYADRGDGSNPVPVEPFVPRQHRAHFQAINWNRIINEVHSFKVSYQHSYLDLDTPRYSDDEIQTLLEAAFGPLPAGTGAAMNDLNPLGIYKDSEVGTTETHDLEYIHTFKFSPGVNAVMGTGMRYERARSALLLQDQNGDWLDETRWRIFGNLEYKALQPWVFNAGAMLEHSTIAGNRLSPRLAANYMLDDTRTLRTAVTRAYRMPSLLSAHSSNTLHYPLGAGDDITTQPNPYINPEEIDSFEIGYFEIFPSLSSQLDVRAFYEDIEQGIGSYFIKDASGDTYIEQRNNHFWTNQGIEFQFKYASRASHATSALFNYSYNNVSGVRLRGSKNDDLLDDRAPMNSASVLLSTKPSANSTVSLAHYYVGKVKWLEGWSEKDPYTDYHRTDLRLAYRFNLDPATVLETSFVVQNLFDKRYSEFYRYNEFDRRTYLQLKLSF